MDEIIQFIKANPLPSALVGGGIGGIGLYTIESEPESNSRFRQIYPNQMVYSGQTKQPVPIQFGNRLIDLDKMDADQLKRQIQYQERRVNTDLITLEELRRLYEMQSQ